MSINLYRLEGGKTKLTERNDLVECLTFSGGEPHVNVREKYWIENSTFLIDARIHNFNELGQLIFLNDSLRNAGAKSVSAFIPYFPGARQDRVENGSPFSAKLYVDHLKLCGFDHIISVDLHSPIVETLFAGHKTKFTNIPQYKVINPNFINEHSVIISPDAGSVKKAEEVALAFGDLEVVYGRKTRKNGKLSGFAIDKERIKELINAKFGVNFVIVDDICDGGGTFNGLAEAIAVHRSRMKLWVTHGIFSQGFNTLAKYYSSIGFTKSLVGGKIAEIRYERDNIDALNDGAEPLLPLIIRTFELADIRDKTFKELI